MTVREQIVHRYLDGFRRSDHEAILACLTDDVVVVTIPTSSRSPDQR